MPGAAAKKLATATPKTMSSKGKGAVTPCNPATMSWGLNTLRNSSIFYSRDRRITSRRHSHYLVHGAAARQPTIVGHARPAASELDEIDAGKNRVVAQLRSVGDLPDRELLLIGRFRRQSIDRNDRLETAQHGAESRVQDSAVGRGADDDDGLDALVLEDLLQVAAGEFIAAAFDDLFIALGPHAGDDIAGAHAAGERMDDQHVVAARIGQELLDPRQRLEAANAGLFGAGSGIPVEAQQRGLLGIDLN